MLILIKIIGIVLVSILALIILLVLTVLFVPIRYRVQGEKYEHVNGDVVISWLFHIIHGHISYNSARDIHPLKIVIRVFGLPVIDNTRVKKDRRSRRRPKEERPIQSSKTDGETKVQPPMNESEKIEDTIQKDTKYSEVNPFVPEKKKKDKKKLKERLAYFFKNIKDKFLRIKSFFVGMKDKLIHIRKKKESILNFMNDESNRAVFKKIWLCIKKVFREILPRKIRGVLHFGFEDPATTGKCLGLMAVFYPKVQNRLKVMPDFESSVFEGTVNMRGHIRLGVIAICGLKLMIDKDVRRLIKDIKNL